MSIRIQPLRIGLALVLLTFVATLIPSAYGPPSAEAAENKILTVTKDAVFGAAAGLLLGGVLMLVVHEGHRGDVVRWGVVVGTFGGFGYGIYEVSRDKDEFSRKLMERRLPPLTPVDLAGADVASAELTGCVLLGRSPGAPIFRSPAEAPAVRPLVRSL